MRKIYMAGMNHKVAEIAIREKFYIPMDIKTRALQESPFDELLILATCNRTEIYVASDRPLCERDLVQYVCDLVHQDYGSYASYFYYKEGDDLSKYTVTQVAEHKDINDEGQTVFVKDGPEVSPPPKTGDNTLLWVYGALFVGAFGSMLALVIKEYIRKRRQAKEDAEMFV